MAIRLDETQARILGSLVEKSLTTPELYPLTLNSLLNACNQKSSRDPVMTLDEATLSRGLHGLLELRLAERVTETGSRVPKFRHRIDVLLGTEDPKAIGLACVLLLRGPQTPGELKTRSERLCQFGSTAEVEAMLQDLAARPDGAQAEKLPRQPGQKESRYRHLWGEVSPEHAVAAAAASPAAEAPVPADRLALLEQRVTALEELVKGLKPGPVPGL